MFKKILCAFIIMVCIMPKHIYALSFKTVSPFIVILENAYHYSIKTSSSTSGKTLVSIDFGQPVTVIGEANNWYQVQVYINNVKKTGYVEKSKFALYKEDSAFEKTLSKFPESYRQPLRYLHSVYPKWNMYPLETNINFETAVSTFSKNALIESSVSSMIASKTIKEGKTWRSASLNAVRYYLDPRNYLKAITALTFHKGSYSSQETLSDVKNMLKGYSLLSYASTFVSAAKSNNISVFEVVTRAKQEQGTTGGLGLKGGYASGDTKTKYYNVFNINASTAQKGIDYAKKQGWNTIAKSITGGIKILSDKYLNKGQYSLYLQRFQVNPKSSYALMTHSYMSNIKAPYDEGINLTKSYCNNNLDTRVKNLYIPIYKNMKTSYAYPDTSETKYFVKEIPVSSGSVRSIKANLNTYNSITINWSGNAKSYTLSYKDNNKVKTIKTNKTSYTVKSLTLGKTYQFTIKTGSNTLTSNKVTTLSKPKLTISKNKNKITLKTNKGNVSGYEYTFIKQKKVYTSKTNTLTKKVKKNIKYTYKIRTYIIVNNKKIYSPYSKVISYTLK